MSDKTEIDERIRSLPCWSGPVTWQPLHGGLSNESFVVTEGNGKFVVRFGQDFPFHHVDRAARGHGHAGGERMRFRTGARPCRTGFHGVALHRGAHL